jgi:hypothetical protein
MVISMFTMYKYHLHLQEYSNKMLELQELLKKVSEITKKSETQINILAQPRGTLETIWHYSKNVWTFGTFGPLFLHFMQNLTIWWTGGR